MEKTISAIATPQGAGGIGIIRISGDRALSVADAVFHAVSKAKLSELPGMRALYGTVVRVLSSMRLWRLSFARRTPIRQKMSSSCSVMAVRLFYAACLRALMKAGRRLRSAANLRNAPF